MSTRLTNNFTLEELTKSGLAMRNGLDNTPNCHEVVKLRALAEHILQPVRDYFGKPFVPSSGFRCKAVNNLAGSRDTSQHRLGEAADFEVPTVANRFLAEWIKANLDFDQLILEFHNPAIPDSGWVHCSYVGNKANRKQCLVFDGKNYRGF